MNFELPDIAFKNRITEDINLPKRTVEGLAIEWESSDASLITNEGLVTRPAFGEGRKSVVLTARIEHNKKVFEKEYILTVLPQTSDDEYGYLFAFFNGNGEEDERLSYALSKNGYDFYALNFSFPVFRPLGGTEHLRDPYVFKGQDKYYLLATDMNTCNGGEWSNQSTVFIWESEDLIRWGNEKILDFKQFKGFENCNRAWAPQAIWCPEKEMYMIYLSLRCNEGGTYMYRTYTKDFTSCSAPEIMFDFEYDAIDGDILQSPIDNRYYMYYKYCENFAISILSAEKLSGVWTNTDPNTGERYADLPRENNMHVEGSTTFKLIGEKRWNTLADCFQKGQFMCLESCDIKNYTILKSSNNPCDAEYYLDMYDYGVTPRHGSVMTIGKSVFEKLEKTFMASSAKEAMYPIEKGPSMVEVRGKNIKGFNCVVDNDKRTLQLVITPGHIKSVEPEFVFVGEMINTSPKGAQDFTDSVDYTFTDSNQNTTAWNISAVECGNGVLSEWGLFADPNIAILKGKYYIYPTTDGKCGWDSAYFKAFSSDDLVHWKDEGIILDLKDVKWSSGHYGWAPTIAQRNGKYYFYYSSGNRKNCYKDLAVAVSDSPIGPFKDIGKPLVEGGSLKGEMIDPQVFIDDDLTPYLFWGNQRLYAAKLNEDMVSFASEIKEITPDNFTEGVFVIKRKGKYYFTWSQGDTRLSSYCVRYGISNSPMERPTGSDIILSEEYTSDKKIKCTAHHSIINIPDTDRWYICYHRFNIPKTVKIGEGYYAGSHREVAIDKLTFDEKGNINTVFATLEGVTEPEFLNE